MELKEFVSKALVDMIEGVHSARKSVQESDVGKAGGVISPRVYNGEALLTTQEGPVAQYVEFDVALSVVESEQYKGEGGAKLMVFSIGGGASAQAQTTTAHRIKFKVPVILPQAEARERRHSVAGGDPNWMA